MPSAFELPSSTPLAYFASLVKDDDSLAESIQSTAQHTATAEPTAGNVLETWHVHPQKGVRITLPLLHPRKVGGGDRVGVRITAPDAVNCLVGMRCEE